MTAKTERSIIDHLFTLGAAGVILKPFELEDIGQLLESFWQKKEAFI